MSNIFLPCAVVSYWVSHSHWDPILASQTWNFAEVQNSCSIDLGPNVGFKEQYQTVLLDSIIEQVLLDVSLINW